MRFFFRKKDESPPFQIQTPLQIVPSNRNFDQLKDCDVALKFWLPEYVEKIIDRMCRFQDTSASDLIRQILFIHLYLLELPPCTSRVVLVCPEYGEQHCWDSD